MAFDEKHLKPLYKLTIGKPGSSYTFSIAERIGLNPALLQRARKLVDDDQYRLDKLLNKAEQDLHELQQKEKKLQKALAENERLNREMKQLMHKEKHEQQLEIMREQNRVSTEKLAHLKELDRNLKGLLIEWRKAEDKKKVIHQMEVLLLKKGEYKVVNKLQKKIDSKYEELPGEIIVGALAMVKKNHQVGTVLELRNKKAIVKIGHLPMQVDLKELVLVKLKKE
jgi:DNA mismatch repair protein MutS2